MWIRGRQVSRTEQLVSLSGVSRSTVFRFLRGENVRPAARADILAAMRKLNIQHEDYSVHKGSTLLISVPPAFKTFKGYDLSISGFMDRAEAYGFHVRLQAGAVSEAITGGPKTPAIAGVFFLGRTIQEEIDEPARLAEAGIPHVFVNRVFDDPAISWVSVDHRQAARDAVFHLFDLGHREVGTWGITSRFRVDREKRVGYVRAFEEKGWPVPQSCLDFDAHGDLEEAVLNLISGGKLPSAWFAASDEHAMRFMKIVRDHGLSVPEDVALVGMDDVESAEYFNPALTSVHIPYERAGSGAFDVLKHLIENPHERSLRIVLKHHIVTRESCGAGPGGRKRDRV